MNFINPKNGVSIAASFIWVGFVSAISFMEAWLKFRAPGISIPLGLGIGRLVFNALNHVEWVLSIVIIFQQGFITKSLRSFRNISFAIALLILWAQTFWLLPKMDARAEKVLTGAASIDPSNMHFVYLGMEVTKVILLMVFGWTLIKERKIE